MQNTLNLLGATVTGAWFLLRIPDISADSQLKRLEVLICVF